MEKLVFILSRFGLSANAASVIGLLLSFVAAGLVIDGRNLVMAAWVLLLAGFFDLLDGKIARLASQPDAFGALWDSSLDRYGEAAIFGSLIFYFFILGESAYALCAFSALVGSFEISYVRARSEGLSQMCQVGFWERGERLVFLALGLAVNNIKMTILCLGVLTHLTAFERLAYSRKKMKAILQHRRSGPLNVLAILYGFVLGHEGTRLKASWICKAIFFIMTLILVPI